MIIAGIRAFRIKKASTYENGPIKGWNRVLTLFRINAFHLYLMCLFMRR